MKGQKELTYLDGQTLTLSHLNSIIFNRSKIDLSESAWKLVKKSRQVISKMMQDPSKAIYGITTGFGSFANVSICKESRIKLQLNLIRSHAVGVGQPVPLDIVRRMIILRINTLAKGRSGIHPNNLKKLIDAFNSDFLPLIPEQGTVGASGDLAPLSHLALGLLGQGLAWDHQNNSYQPAEGILLKLGLTKLLLQEKEGLALINGTQFMSAILSQVSFQAISMVESSLALYSFAVQIFGIDRNLFSESSQQFYKKYNPQLGEIIGGISALIGEDPSKLYSSRQLNQEVKSLLDFPQTLAGTLKSIRFCQGLIEAEMNGATDNPLVYFKEDGFDKDQLVSAGNFHGQYVAKAADFLGFAIFQLGKFSESRIERYINGKLSRLYPFLIKNGGLNSGFMISQYTAAALLSESKILVKPASVDSIVTSAGQQDHVSMGGYAARKSRLLLHNMAYICGIELLLALNAVEQLQLQTSPELTKMITKIKDHIEPMIEDRYYAPDIQAAKGLILSNLTKL